MLTSVLALMILLMLFKEQQEKFSVERKLSFTLLSYLTSYFFLMLYLVLHCATGTLWRCRSSAEFKADR